MTESESTTPQLKRLTQFYQDWQVALTRLQMAEQSIQGARSDAAAKEGRFKGAVELLMGPGGTWSFDPQNGIKLGGEGDASSPIPGAMLLRREIRASRRALAKGKKP